MAYGDLIQFTSDGTAVAQLWTKLELGTTAGKDEAWLRDTLRDYADTVPVRAIDPAYGPLISVCTELPIRSGRMDNLFVSPNGRLTLVECKLWRNQQARREVVAQILDYAKEIATWSYSDLQKAINSRTSMSGNHLFNLVQAKHPTIQEAEFIDNVETALRQGKFMLLIAGDGIKSDVKALTELIDRQSTAAFTFGMVEVAMYQAPDKSILVQPRLLASTVMLERTLIIVQGLPGNSRVVEAEPTAGDETKEKNPAALIAHQTMRTWWDPLLAAARRKLNDPDQEPLAYFAPNNVRAAMPWHGTWVLAYRSVSPPRLGVSFRGRSGANIEALRAIADDIPEILPNLPEDTQYEPGESLSIEVTSTDFPDDAARQEWLLDNINAFVNELRPVLTKALKR